MTKGSRRAQQIKLNATGLTDYEAHIVDGKDDDAFEAVIGDRDPDSVWKIGNSPRSDGLPAIGAGLNVLLIADADYTATWVGEETDEKLPVDGPWFRRDDLESFKNDYNIMDAFDETGDIDLLKENR